MSKSLLFLAILFIFGAKNLKAQDEGQLHFKGICLSHHIRLENATIEAFIGNKKVASTNSDGKGNFKLNLDYGDDYKVVFKYQGYVDMSALIYAADMPENKRNIDATYEITVPFYEKDLETIAVDKFKEPFTHVMFDGKNKFVDDVKYLKTFTESLVLIPDDDEPDHNSIFTKVYVNPFPPDKVISLSGRLKSGNEILTGFTVVLKDSTGKVVKTTVTNKYGVFAFQQLKADNFGMVEVTNDDESKLGNKTITLTTQEQEVILNAIATNGKAQFNLNSNDRNEVLKKLRDDNYKLKIAGKIVYNDSIGATVLSKKKIYLIDENGKVLETSQTNLFGGFVFNKVPYDANFMIQLDEKDLNGIDKSKIEIYNYSGTNLGVLVKNDKGFFVYKYMKSDYAAINEMMVEDSQLRIDLKGKIYGDNISNPISNKVISIIDMNGKIITSANTDNGGSFRLKGIPFGKRFQIHFKDSSLFTEFTKIFITDDMGKIIKTFYINGGKAYDFKMLVPDQNKLGFVYVDDPWFLLSDNITKSKDKPVLIVESIYFGFNSADLLPAAKLSLEKATVLMKMYATVNLDLSAHTDSKGSTESNLVLSEKRAQAALNYLVSRGISKDRIVATGLGESKAINKCVDGVECSEEEYAKNRRIEFSFKMK